MLKMIIFTFVSVIDYKNKIFGLYLFKKIAYSVQTNNSIKIMNLVSFKGNTKMNSLVLVKMNRNTVFEIFGSSHLRNECES